MWKRGITVICFGFINQYHIHVYTFIDFSEVDIRIYLPEKSDNSQRPLSMAIEVNNCFVI